MPTEQVAITANNLDLSLVIALSALILSVLSPLLSAVISGIFRLKEKQLEIKAETDKRTQEFYEQHRAEVIEQYIKAVGQAAKRPTRDNLSEFGISMGEIYLYVDQSLWPLLDSISQKIDFDRFEDPSGELIELCKELYTQNIRSKDNIGPDESDSQAP